MTHVESHKQSGFSLIELSVSMAVLGLIGVLVWRMTAATQEPDIREAAQSELQQAQAAVDAFVLAKHRLPCPATSRSGDEDCSSSTALLLPWRTLGVSPALSGLHYGVNRGGGFDLAAVAAATVSPDLGLDLTGVPAMPSEPAPSPSAVLASTQVSAFVAAASARRTIANGLDFCRVLRSYSSNLGASGVLKAGNISDSLPIAFILVHPGRNDRFDGNNTPGSAGSWRFDLPGRPQVAEYDDLAHAVGPSELAYRLGCVQRMSAAQAAAQAAFAQYDNTRMAQEYWSLRAFDIESAKGDVDGAQTGVVMAAMGLALTTTSAAVGLASAANTEGITAFAVVIQIANVAIAVTEVALAAQDLTDAKQALIDSQEKFKATGDYVVQAYTTLSEALTQSISLDTKGLNP